MKTSKKKPEATARLYLHGIRRTCGVSEEDYGLLSEIALRSGLAKAAVVRALVHMHRDDVIRIEKTVSYAVSVESSK